MDFLVIGTIKSIIPNKYGIFVNVRETKIGGTSKNGHEIGTHDFTWGCLAQSEAIQKYVKNYFRVGAIVKIKGVIEQSSVRSEETPNSRVPVFKIESRDLWNMGDPLKRKIRERYNTNVVGEERPNMDNNFNDDF